MDTGAVNRKLGSDMADSVTGGGIHGKDLSKADVSLRQYRTEIVPILRSQIFRQMRQKPQLILYVLTRIFVKYDGKDASKMGAKPICGLCAVLPYIYAFLQAQKLKRIVEYSCAIGDENICGVPYAEIVREAGKYIKAVGGFEKLAEWGLF